MNLKTTTKKQLREIQINMNKIKYQKDVPSGVRFDKLPVGQAFTTSFGPGGLFLKTYTGMVSLDNPNKTWDNVCALTLTLPNYQEVDLEIIVRPV